MHRSPLKKTRDLQAAMRLVVQRTTAELVRMRAKEERKKYFHYLSARNQLETLGALSAGIAHDLNNLLTPISLLTELARGELPAGHAAQEHLARVERAAARARGLVKQIVAGGNPRELPSGPVHLQEIVSDATSLLLAGLDSKVEVRLAMCPPDWRVDAVPTRLHQIVMNLGSNAGHALEGRRGAIEFAVKEVAFDVLQAPPSPTPASGRYVLLTVSDNGVGMDTATCARIFEPFFTTRSPDKGSGLGLSVVQEIVRELGGAIRVASEPGRGTTFEVFLPAIPPADAGR